jgi:hypothetical protein
MVALNGSLAWAGTATTAPIIAKAAMDPMIDLIFTEFSFYLLLTKLHWNNNICTSIVDT